ncbi:hypothetical protein ACFL9T_22240 [Thermodesulfobacteriota bacterium]
MSNTPQGEAIEGNPAVGGTDDALMVDQAIEEPLEIRPYSRYSPGI